MLRRVALITVCLIISSVCLTVLGCAEPYDKTARLGKGIMIDKTDVSGMTAEEAEKTLSKAHEKQLKEQRYIIETDEDKAELSAEELGITYDPKGAIEDALALNDDTDGEKSAREFFSDANINESHAKEAIHKAAKDLAQEGEKASCEYRNGEMVFNEGKSGSLLDEDALLGSIKESLAKPDVQEVHIKAVLIEDGEDGKNANTSSEIEKLKKDNTLIAEYTTYFNKEPYNAENRVKNIVKAAGLIDGAVIEPDKKLDMNAILGDRNRENGWSEAPGIRDGKYEMEYGGGVCQVSSTLYNAALIACLEIVERSPHSWPIGYVPIGRDATISTGGPNLIIKNNTNAKITVSAVTDDEAQSVTVKIFGRFPDEADYAYVDIESEQTGTIPAPKTEVIVDKSLSPGEQVTDRKARDGKTAKVERVYYDKDKNEIRREVVSEDKYRAIGARILKGA